MSKICITAFFLFTFVLKLILLCLITCCHSFSFHRISFDSVQRCSFSTTLFDWKRRMSAASSSAADTMTSKSKSTCPALSIPPMLVSTVPGTWAFDTMSRRVDSEILQRTYDENEEMLFRSSPTILAQFQGLRHELQNAATTPMRYLNKLSEITGDDDDDEWSQWNLIVQPYVENNDTWLSTPWLVAEFYLYRRLLECTGYFDPLSIGYKYDPFQTQKRSGLFSSIASAERVMEKIEALTNNNDANDNNNKWNRDGTAFAVELALWGNKMDLSLWPVSNTASKEQQQQQLQKEAFSKVLEAAKENLLHDDTDQLLELCETLQRKGGGNIDIIVDNAGFELVTDLILADHLISNGIAKCVTFQLKSHPTFVSDAMEKDLMETVQYFQSLDESYPCCVRAGKRWASYLSSGEWICKENKFWVQGRAMWEMDEHLFSDLTNRCDLAFVKGDANYRRLLGDCAWDFTTSFQQIVGVYFPSPVCALRTLKSEVACGIDASQVQRASSLDNQWLVNGRFGVVHFGTGARPS